MALIDPKGFPTTGSGISEIPYSLFCWQGAVVLLSALERDGEAIGVFTFMYDLNAGTYCQQLVTTEFGPERKIDSMTAFQLEAAIIAAEQQDAMEVEEI